MADAEGEFSLSDDEMVDEENVDDEEEEEENNEELEEDDDGENGGYTIDPLYYMRLIRQMIGSAHSHEVFSDSEPEESLPSPGPSTALLEERIAEEITSATRAFPNAPPRPICGMLLQREIYQKCPLSAHDRTYITQRHLPCHGRILEQYNDKIFCGQYSRDGTVFMSAAQDRRVRLYNTDTWKIRKQIDAINVEWSVIDIDYSPDQRWIIYSSWSDYVQICNLQGDFEIHEALDFRPQVDRFCLFSIKFSPGSNEILGGSSDKKLYVYDIDRKERVLQVPAHTDDINTVCYLDESGDTIVSGSDDRLVKVWDRRMLGTGPARGTRGCVGVLAGHGYGITHISPKGDGRYLISNGKDQCIKLWDIRRMLPPSTDIHQPSNNEWDYRYGGQRRVGRNPSAPKHPNDVSLQTYRGHGVYQTLIRAYFSPASTTGQKYIYTGSYDKAIYIYDVLTGEVVSKLTGHEALIRDLSWHPYETQITSTSWDASIWNWGLEEISGLPKRNRRRIWDD